MKCIIEDIDDSSNCVKLNCTYTQGRENCGKRYLRNPTRAIVGKELQQKAVHVYRAEKADMLMEEGNPEPPHLYSSAVLHAAKAETIKANYIHSDPLKALVIFKSSSMRNVIHNIGLDPFFIHYWSNHQLNIYRNYCVKNNACIFIDATGSIVKKLCKADGSISKHMFLYQCVINCNNGQFSICQMISESHNANSIHFWLAEWIRSGASVPKEVVCDSSKALLIAIIRAFTGYRNIEDYADAFKNSNLHKCYIRIDVAHFIKLYSKTCKNLNKRVKTFYLGAIGQLILSRNIINAKEILKSIFTIALSETDGNLKSGHSTHCDLERVKLVNLMTTNNDFDNLENFETNIDSAIFEIEEPDETETNIYNNPFENYWSTWAKQILSEVKSSIASDVGDRINPHYFPRIVEHLISDIKSLPLWSNIYRDQFGYGRVPASSASIEGEFNKLKSLLLKNCPLLRIDSFIQKHVDYLRGVLKIVDAQNTNITSDSNDILSSIPIKANMSSDNLMLENSSNSCPACKNSDKLSNAHVCYFCKKNVHVLCSLPFGDKENYSRVCTICKDVQDIKDIFASREVENWRGKTDSTKNALYLGRNAHKITDALKCKKAAKIPIMKNGNDITLKSLKINNDNYTVVNTCAFDSIFQILLAAGHDLSHIFTYMEETIEINLFFKLIIYTVKNGINLNIYKLRAEILLNIFPASDVAGCKYIDCETNVGYLASILFKETPSFKEMSQCNFDCPPRCKKLPVIQIEETKIVSGTNFDDIIKQNVILEGEHPCCAQNCSGLEKTTLSETGK